MSPVNRTAPQFAELLSRALSEPGVVSRAYAAFHDYSLGNPRSVAGRWTVRIVSSMSGQLFSVPDADRAVISRRSQSRKESKRRPPQPPGHSTMLAAQ
jgi:hypothetical protein